MDILADVLSAARVGGVVTAHVRAEAPWGFRLQQTPFAAFHAVAQGTCWLRLPKTPPRQLLPGDVTLLPSGTGHIMASSPTGAVVPYEEVMAAHAPPGDTDIDIPGPGPVTRLICGAYPFDAEVTSPLMSLLPPVLHIPAEVSESRPGLQATLRMLSAELAESGPGSRAIIDRLVDVLFVHVLRAWLDSGEPEQGSWLTALRDPLVAAAISHMHADPAHPWTVAELASAVGLSRATFARRFSDLVGRPPLDYLTGWRLDLAARRLRDTDQSVAHVAHAVGYTSEYAFSRAFQRQRGTSPSRYRTATRHPTAV
jgi:AraC-like DNA-binding protein